MRLVLAGCFRDSGLAAVVAAKLDEYAYKSTVIRDGLREEQTISWSVLITFIICSPRIERRPNFAPHLLQYSPPHPPSCLDCRLSTNWILIGLMMRWLNLLLNAKLHRAPHIILRIVWTFEWSIRKVLTLNSSDKSFYVKLLITAIYLKNKPGLSLKMKTSDWVCFLSALLMPLLCGGCECFQQTLQNALRFAPGG